MNECYTAGKQRLLMKYEEKANQVTLLHSFCAVLDDGWGSLHTSVCRAHWYLMQTVHGLLPHREIGIKGRDGDQKGRRHRGSMEGHEREMAGDSNQSASHTHIHTQNCQGANIKLPLKGKLLFLLIKV